MTVTGTRKHGEEHDWKETRRVKCSSDSFSGLSRHATVEGDLKLLEYVSRVGRAPRIVGEFFPHPLRRVITL